MTARCLGRSRRPWPCGPPCLETEPQAATRGTTHRRVTLVVRHPRRCRRWRTHTDPEQCRRVLESRAVARTAAAIRADRADPGRQHGVQNTAEQRRGRDRTVLGLSWACVCGGARDHRVVPWQETASGEGHPHQGTGAIRQGGSPGAHGCTLSAPVRCPEGWGHTSQPGRLVHGRAARRSVHPGACRNRDEPVRPGGEPGRAIGRPAATGDQRVDVRRRAPVAAPGVEPPEHAERAPQNPGGASACVPRGGGTAHKKRREAGRRPAGHRPAPRRQGTGDQHVRHGEQERPVGSEPRVRGIVLAGGTRPLCAGMVPVLGLLAGVAVIPMAPQGRSAARGASLHGAERAGPPPGPPRCARGRAGHAHAIGASSQGRGPLRRLSASAALAAAVAVRGGARAVGAGALWPRACGRSRRVPPAARRGVAQEWRPVGPEACWWRPLSCKAARQAPCPRWRGMGGEAVDRPRPLRPGAGHRHRECAGRRASAATAHTGGACALRPC